MPLNLPNSGLPTDSSQLFCPHCPYCISKPNKTVTSIENSSSGNSTCDKNIMTTPSSVLFHSEVFAEYVGSPSRNFVNENIILTNPQHKTPDLLFGLPFSPHTPPAIHQQHESTFDHYPSQTNENYSRKFFSPQLLSPRGSSPPQIACVMRSITPQQRRFTPQKIECCSPSSRFIPSRSPVVTHHFRPATKSPSKNDMLQQFCNFQPSECDTQSDSVLGNLQLMEREEKLFRHTWKSVMQQKAKEKNETLRLHVIRRLEEAEKNLTRTHVIDRRQTETVADDIQRNRRTLREHQLPQFSSPEAMSAVGMCSPVAASSERTHFNCISSSSPSFPIRKYNPSLYIPSPHPSSSSLPSSSFSSSSPLVEVDTSVDFTPYRNNHDGGKCAPSSTLFL